MPTLALPLVPNWPVGSFGKPCVPLVRVKPTRAELTIAGEKICTQFAPISLVGKIFDAGKGDRQHRESVPSYAVDME